MKVTEQEWVRATAQAMARPDTIELFNNVPDSFDSFALFSYEVYERVKGKDFTGWQFIEKLVEVVTEILPDRKPTKEELTRMLALVTFGMSIYKSYVTEKT
jgi:hypothetical protein